MIKKWIKNTKKEDGSISILVALLFVALIAMSGLVVDLGRSYVEAASLQGAADAAAYASATLLPVKTGDTDAIDTVKTKALEYVVKNGRAETDFAGILLGDEVNGQYTSVQVNLTSNIVYIFGAFLGKTDGDVAESAKVRIEAVITATGMVPLGLTKSNLDAVALDGAQDVVLKYGAGSGTSGNYGALDLDGVKRGGADDYEWNLSSGYDKILAVGDVVISEPGNMAEATATAFVARWGACTHFADDGGCTPDHFESDCPRVILVLVYEEVSIGYKVVGFVSLILTGSNTSGELTGSLINANMKDLYIDTAPLSDTTIEHGVFSAKLVG